MNISSKASLSTSFWSNAFTSYDDDIMDVTYPIFTIFQFGFSFDNLAFGDTFDHYADESGREDNGDATVNVSEPATVIPLIIGFVCYWMLWGKVTVKAVGDISKSF